MSNLKLGVEVVSAHNLMPKDGQGSCNAFVELNFDGQKFRTSIKEKDVNPVWNEIFYFNISDPNNLRNLDLDAYVYNHVETSNSFSFLGKVRLTGTSFDPDSNAAVLRCPLEKRVINFSRVKKELRLKAFQTDDYPSSIISSNSPPAMESPLHAGSHPMQSQMAARPVQNLGSSSQPGDNALKETSPFLGGGQIRADKRFDLVELMQFLYVKVVKGRDLPFMDVTGSLDPYVEVKVGNFKGVTEHFEKNQNPVWNRVFAFDRDRMQSSVLEVVVKNKDYPVKDEDIVGIVRFDLNDPTRDPLDSPSWYHLEDKKGEKTQGDLMLDVWMGTQADEAFPVAWHSDICPKVYHSPRLWYLRVNVIEAKDLVIAEKTHIPDVHVKAQIGNQVSKTKTVRAETPNPEWNEDLILVAAEPFEDHLFLTVEDRAGPNKDEVIGKVIIPLNSVENRTDDRNVDSQWFDLAFCSRLHLRVSLDGGYHVLDESTHYDSDLRPTAKQLWKPSIGVLELGILNVGGLHPMKTRDGKGTSDAYCVAKYGHKWVRSRTIIDSLSPKYNEQYTWEVYDPATVLTVGVFDNSLQIGETGSARNKDVKIGKVRIRLSTLETGRVYTQFYPLLALHPSGVKKMGELHLAIRFSCTSVVKMMFIYSRPLLPKMHYTRPLTVMQLDMLRHQAVNTVAARLSRAEPPLRKEVVEYMSDDDSHMWSMRRSKVNFFRLMGVLSGLIAGGKWFGEVCMWGNPVKTMLVHVFFVMLVCFPELIVTTVFLYMSVIGILNFRYRPRYPPHTDTRISQANAVHPDELDEEFDTFPTSRRQDLVRMRYDRLRSVAGRIQTVVGDVATQGERIQALVNWQDPRVTAIFVAFCLLAAIVFYVTPFQVIVLVAGFYLMRHPWFRHRSPSAPINFFHRLPSRADALL